MKHLCLLIQDDPDWYDPRASLKGFNPPVTKDTVVLKSPHTQSAISNIEVVRKFGATHNRGEPGTLVIISHGAFEKTGLLSSRPIGGAIGFGGGKFLTRGTAGKLLGWTPFYNDIIMVGCAVAATTAALPEDPVAFDGNGTAFCRVIANLLSVTVHASTTPMTMNMWKTPSRGDSVMEWANFLARAGNYVAFKAAE
jgi:hypothetical protein